MYVFKGSDIDSRTELNDKDIASLIVCPLKGFKLILIELIPQDDNTLEPKFKELEFEMKRTIGGIYFKSLVYNGPMKPCGFRIFYKDKILIEKMFKQIDVTDIDSFNITYKLDFGD